MALLAQSLHHSSGYRSDAAHATQHQVFLSHHYIIVCKLRGLFKGQYHLSERLGRMFKKMRGLTYPMLLGAMSTFALIERSHCISSSPEPYTVMQPDGTQITVCGGESHTRITFRALHGLWVIRIGSPRPCASCFIAVAKITPNSE